MKALFSQPEYSLLDGLNDYDDDFTSFSPRGCLLTHDMVREFRRKENQLRTKSKGKKQAVARYGQVFGYSIHQPQAENNGQSAKSVSVDDLDPSSD